MEDSETSVTLRSAVDTLPFDIWRKIFSEYIAENSPQGCIGYCHCELEHDIERYMFRKDFLELRLVCKDFSNVIKPLTFRSVRMGCDWLSDPEQTYEGLSSLLNSTSGDGGILISHCIRSISWQHNENPDEDVGLVEAYKYLPNLRSLRINRVPGSSRHYIYPNNTTTTVIPLTGRWEDDRPLASFVHHQLTLPATSLYDISIINIDNVPIHTILACPTLDTLVLTCVTFAPHSDNPPSGDISATHNLRRLAWRSSAHIPSSLIPYLPKLKTITVNTTYNRDSRHFRPILPDAALCNGCDTGDMPRPWAALEEVMYYGPWVSFQSFFGLENASSAGVTLFPSLQSLVISVAHKEYPVLIEPPASSALLSKSVLHSHFPNVNHLAIDTWQWSRSMTLDNPLLPILRYLNVSHHNSLEEIEILVSDLNLAPDEQTKSLEVIERLMKGIEHHARLKSGFSGSTSSRFPDITFLVTLRTVDGDPMSRACFDKLTSIVDDVQRRCGIKIRFKVRTFPCVPQLWCLLPAYVSSYMDLGSVSPTDVDYSDVLPYQGDSLRLLFSDYVF
ncbi:hypothetical protein CVT24_004607 [Panaeolus cyanescens]|uniref:Uncharacterized protein n=1 Tax=Panaeolus cyanescens TaxID=181874 RepID=A0A409YBE4_9AGAR|nr:hypothetical protein CVT24_004607 [Panaeolus cyanescens]